MNPAWIVFIVALTPYALGYYWIKDSLDSTHFVLVTVLYLIVIRVISDKVAKRFTR